MIKKSFKRRIYTGNGITPVPVPAYQFPEGHPCCGCSFTFETYKPSCIAGSYPDTKNCINAFYKKLVRRKSL